MNTFLIIRTGGTFPEHTAHRGDFEHWTAQAMGLEDEAYHCVNVQAGEPLPDPKAYAGCAITGSHDMVTDESLPWIEYTCQWLRQAATTDLPIIGICFGHQLLAQALGGKAGFHADGPEIGTMPITLTEDAASDTLFSHMPAAFPGHTTHYQCALALPKDTTLLARSEHEPHQAFRYGDHIWGVQFHPEFNAEDMRCYIASQSDVIKEHGGDTNTLLSQVQETPESTDLMVRFVEYCLYAVR